jgi:hypothetical protein
MPIHQDNEGQQGEPQPHTNEAWAWLDDQLYERFTGRTLAPGLYEGVWKNPKTGKPIADQSRKYLVALPEHAVDERRRLLAEACVVFQQQMIYLNVAGRVEFIEAPKNDPTP